MRPGGPSGVAGPLATPLEITWAESDENACRGPSIGYKDGMVSDFRRVLPFVLALLFACPLVSSATDLKTRRGESYTGVTIIRREKGFLEISAPRGKTVRLPWADITQIDGVQLLPAGGSPPAVTPVPTGSPQSQPSPAPRAGGPSSASGTPPGRTLPRPGSLVYATPAGEAFDPPATPPVMASATPLPALLNQNASPPAAETGESDEWLFWTVGVAIAWIVLMVAVFSDLRHRKQKAAPWLYVAILVPVFGGLAYYLFGRRSVPRPVLRKEDAEPFAEFQFLDESRNLITLKPGVEASGIRNAKDILNDALLDRASDVHIEPSSSEYRVRFRVDGMLAPRMKFSPEEGIRLVSAVKSLAQMDIAEKRKAQDGRFGGRRGSREVDFRVATTPSVFGEKLVVRVLDSKTGLSVLNELGMTEEMMKQFAQVIHSRSGMILATGPTGSGKTSTLYAALAQLDATGLNLVTIEDPVEYQLSGATQIPVNVRAGVTYESGLRSVLRQDPDVILVGEMRDREAAVIALRSALTGHLVFSSLHTPNSIGTITRLEEIGIERHLLASSLFVIMAQRLVRVPCAHCRETYACKSDELAEVGIELPEGSEIYRAKGCRRCDGTGYLGRTGVFEMLIFDDELRQAVNDGAGEAELYALAHRKGYRGYREDAAMKVLLGLTTVDEVLKAV